MLGRAMSMMAKKRSHAQRLANRVVLITGASSGIGEACAWRFAEDGSKLVLVARRQDRLQKVKDELLSEFPDLKVHLEVLDVADLGKAIQIQRERERDG